MPSEAAESYTDLPTIKSLLISKGLSLNDADRWEDIVRGRADALKRIGTSEPDIERVKGLIDDILMLPKSQLRCSVIKGARDAINSLL